MSAQNIVSLGLDVTSFSEEKKTLLSEYIGLFEKLEKYDGLKVNPIMGEGLTSFNDAISKTNVLLDEMKVKMGELASVQATANQTSKTSSNSKREESAEMQNYNKLVAESEKLRAKIAAATSDEAKEVMALRLQLSELTRATLEEAKGSLQSVEAKQAQKQAEKDLNDERMRVVAVLEQQHVANLKAEKDNLSKQKLEEAEATRQLRLEEEALNVQAKEFEANERAKKKALEDEAKATQMLTQDYRILKQALIEQRNAYALAYRTHGAESPQAKEALGNYASTAGIITDIDNKLKNASGTTKLFGGALSGAFSQLRMIAYILPGLGIAGIFNLAFEAISNAAEGLHLFTNEVDELIKRETEVNNHLRDQFALYESITQQREKLNNLSGNILSVNQERKTALDQSGGTDPGTILAQKTISSQNAASEAAQRIPNFDGTEKAIIEYEKAIDATIKRQQENAKKLEFLNHLLDAKDQRSITDKLNAAAANGGVVGLFKEAQTKRVDGTLYFAPKSVTEDLVKDNKARIDAEQAFAAQSLKDLEKYVQTRGEFEKNLSALVKFNQDQLRKFTVDTARDNISVIVDKNKAILSNERSTQQERIAALHEIEKQEKRLSDINAYNVTGNKSSTQEEKDIATNKASTERRKADMKEREDEERVNTEFYQRHIKAVKDVQKDELDATAIAQEKIANNEKNSLEDRLAAYNKYLLARQQMQILEENVALQKGASHAGGKTSLTDEEKLQIEQAAATQRANIQADAEKKVYDIVSSSAASQFKIIKEANEHQSLESEISETADLHRINEALRKKQISYKNYYAEREIIEKKYRTRNLEEAVQDDKLDLSRLEELEDKQKGDLSKSDKSLFTSKVALDQNPTLENQKRYDEEVGANKAINDAIIKTDNERLTVKARLVRDELNLEKTALDDELKARKEQAELLIEIEEALYNLARTAIDANYQRRLEHLEMNKQIVDEQYGYEIAAIEKSSLSAKDKAALDIQLKEQQREYDKKTAIEARKLKHDQAVADKELSIAHILWTTEEAVMNALALKLPPPLPETIAIERGILGGIAVATVLAEPIPSYQYGVESHPGGLARFGEAGPELIKEPYKQPYYAFEETIKVLPKGTEVIPIHDSPEFSGTKKDDGWEQTRWLAKQMKKNNKPVNNTFSPVINIDLGYESYKRKIIGN